MVLFSLEEPFLEVAEDESASTSFASSFGKPAAIAGALGIGGVGGWILGHDAGYDNGYVAGAKAAPNAPNTPGSAIKDSLNSWVGVTVAIGVAVVGYKLVKELVVRPVSVQRLGGSV